MLALFQIKSAGGGLMGLVASEKASCVNFKARGPSGCNLKYVRIGRVDHSLLALRPRFQGDDMKIDILYKPAHSVAHVQLERGESVTAESGAMVSTSGNVSMTTSAGGLKKGLKRLFGGESFFRNTFTAEGREGEVLLAPALCGDMTVIDIDRADWFIASSAYVGGDGTIDLQTKVGGFKGFFSGAGVFILRATGHGQVILGAFGALECVDVNGELVIDTGHLVAWEDSRPVLCYEPRPDGSLVFCRRRPDLSISGPRKVWVQTRNPSEYGSLIGRLLTEKARTD